MNAMTRERWNEMEDDPGLLAHEMLQYDVYGLPDEDDSLVFCPECGEMAASFAFIEHKSWCLYGSAEKSRSPRSLYG